MNKHRINIAIYEPSLIIYEGLANVIAKGQMQTNSYRLTDFDELKDCLQRYDIDVVLMNPGMMQNRMPEFMKLKKHYTKVSWIALVYSYFDDEILNQFRDTISILDSHSSLMETLNNSVVKTRDEVNKEQLSLREVEVLKYLIKGLSNREIAHLLNISTHTVVSHRKKIIDKTGIKSLPGLTIFAITQKIISLSAV
ncbi:MAG: LuxR C-terminal-related transcriptional regulator [Carboxylicivirga sp.]|nr:LuxR C-terminal-related transcriptional regulator [Carboxylicivirga sp.]